MDIISSIVAKINSFLWDFALLFLLCGTGIYFTIRLKFVQITKFKDGWDRTFGTLSLSGKAADKYGMSSFQSLATAVAAQIGTGNFSWSCNGFDIWRTWSYILDVVICIFWYGYNICRGFFRTAI